MKKLFDLLEEENSTPLSESVKQVIDDNARQSSSVQPKVESNRHIDAAQKKHNSVREQYKELQELKRLSMAQRTEILKALEKGQPLQQVLLMCIECINSTVHDEAFKRQAIKNFEENYK